MAISRTGVYTLTKMLTALCRAIAKFTPVLIAVSGSDPVLITALTAANTACEALRLSLEPYANPEY